MAPYKEAGCIYSNGNIVVSYEEGFIYIRNPLNNDHLRVCIPTFQLRNLGIFLLRLADDLGIEKDE